jgi:twitching motility protein PilT
VASSNEPYQPEKHAYEDDASGNPVPNRLQPAPRPAAAAGPPPVTPGLLPPTTPASGSAPVSPPQVAPRGPQAPLSRPPAPPQGAPRPAVAPGQAHQQPRQAPQQPRQAPQQPGQAPQRPGQAPVQPGHAPQRPGQGPSQPGQTPQRPGQAPLQPGQAAPRQGLPGTPQGVPGGVPAQPPAAVPRPAAAPATQAQRPEGSLLTQDRPEAKFDLSRVLHYLLETGASDLHVAVGSPPMLRLRGELVAIPDHPVLTPQSVITTLYAILTQKQRETFEENLELDFAYALPGAARFRVNLYRQRESVGAAFRVIPYEIKSLEQLGITPTINTFAGMPRGMVLVTGPTGSGKSTTLAALVDLANRTRHDHIMTVEDPIEFLHQNKNCLINQREVGEDTKSFANALKHVLRQDPDIILVGELRDLETISVALTAAETGHLVFATLHTQDAAQTVDRVIDVFPPHQQQQVRVQLAGAIQGVVCQTLCKTADGKGRVAATEVMFATPAIRNLIREGKTHQIYSSLQAGASHGMQTMDQNLAELVKARKITFEHGLEKCHHVEDFKRLTGKA